MDLTQPVFIPIELVRQILELAAIHLPTAFTLCIVSKEVHGWITPILYRTVTLLGPKEDNGDDYGDATPPTGNSGPRVALPHTALIKNLYLSPTTPYITDILNLTSLRNLAIPDFDQSSPEITHIPANVTHLTVGTQRFSAFTLFRSVTHLFVAQGPEAISFGLLGFAKSADVPNLTHVVWAAWSELSLLNSLVEVLISLELKNLRVIGLQQRMVRRSWQAYPDYSWDSMVEEAPWRHDKRIVIIPGAGLNKFDSSQWNDWFEGGENIWETAERLLAQSLSHPAA